MPLRWQCMGAAAKFSLIDFGIVANILYFVGSFTEILIPVHLEALTQKNDYLRKDSNPKIHCSHFDPILRSRFGDHQRPQYKSSGYSV
jgi:hypothetical protein